MRVGIFYLSLVPGLDRAPMRLPSGTTVYIRVEEVDADGLLSALDGAQPRDDETLMNTHPLDYNEFNRDTQAPRPFGA